MEKQTFFYNFVAKSKKHSLEKLKDKAAQVELAKVE